MAHQISGETAANWGKVHFPQAACLVVWLFPTLLLLNDYTR
jgi:hypothetical protein